MFYHRWFYALPFFGVERIICRQSKMQNNDINFEIKLIKLVQQNPPLYDKIYIGSKHRALKDKLWNSIDKQLNSKAGSCYADWAQLRTQFTDYLRKLSTCESEGKPMPKFRHSETMAFYKKHYNPSAKTLLTNLQCASMQMGPDYSSEGENQPLLAMDAAEDYDDIRMKHEPLESEPPSPDLKEGEQSMPSDENENRRRPKTSDENKNGPDEFDIFCSCLAPKIRRIHEKSPIAAEQLQVEILECILEAHKEVL